MTTVYTTSSGIGSTTQTTVGTITTGVWEGSVVAPTYGGTGVNNGASTVTIGGNFAISGAHTFTGTITGDTTVTFPTSGTLATTATANVISVTGTSNEIVSSPTTGSVILSLANNAILPGTGGVQIPGGTTAQRAGSAGTMRFNSQSGVFESTVDGATWATIETSATGVISVSGDSSTIQVTPTTGLCVVSILSTYAGQSSIATVGTITSGTWHGSVVGLAYGGTNANNTASAGGIPWSDASKINILAGTTTANQLLLSGNAATPAWSTSTYPATNAANTLLYASSANTMAALATANNGVLTTGTGGAPAITALASDGQLIIGSSAGAPAAATISAGTGISISNGHNTITVASTSASTNWVDQTSTPVTLVVNTSYVADNAGLVTLNMPATVAFGSVFNIVGQGAGGWLIQMNTGQVGHLNSTATTSAGSFASTERYDAITLVCTVANTTFVAINSSGVITNA